jgi:hypothetical protein
MSRGWRKEGREEGGRGGRRAGREGGGMDHLLFVIAISIKAILLPK